MTGEQVVAFDDRDHHHSVQRLLPWYANGTLEAGERERVERHLSHCALCSADVLAQQQLRAAVGAGSDAPPADPAWQRLQVQLGVPARPAALRTRATSAGLRAWRAMLQAPPPLRGALALQTALILVLGVLAWQRPPAELAGPYVTRGMAAAPVAGSDRILVAFDANASLAQLRHALRVVHGRISDGPTETGACVLEVPAGSLAAALVALRGEPGVRLAESLGPGSPP